MYRPVFESSAWLARQAGIDPEHFRDGLQEVAQAVCRGWRHMPTRQSLIRCALRAARFEVLDGEPLERTVDERLEARRTLVHELAHGHPDDPLIAAILKAPSQREAARLLGILLRRPWGGEVPDHAAAGGAYDACFSGFGAIPPPPSSVGGGGYRFRRSSGGWRSCGIGPLRNPRPDLTRFERGEVVMEPRKGVSYVPG